MKKPIKKPVKKEIKPKKVNKPVKTETKKESAGAEKSKRTFNLLRGMHDILPKEERYWKAMFHASENLASYFQFGRIETPVLEEASLFVRAVGKGTDVVDKEMYLFEDRDGSKVCMRPENTAAIVRAYIMYGMWNAPQPVKLWYWGSMFRHDRPQAGRYRQFTQVGYETLGSHDPAADAELILVAYNFYQELGLPVTIHINSLGTPEERVRYKSELVNYYRSKRSYLCEDCKQRLVKNPLRLLDCKAEQCQGVKDEAPQIIDWLGTESKSHLTKVLEYLDAVEVPYQLTHTLVRGLDYYTHTVFEIYPDTPDAGGGAQSALGGGGRYDLLVEEMGGRPTPACGFALGLERSFHVLKQYLEQNGKDIPKERPDVFFAQLGEEARKVTLKLINDLRKSGLKIGFNFFKNSLKTQLELADGFKVPYVLIIGQKEVQDNTVIIRDMESGIQEIVDQKKLETMLKKKLGKV
ncbi:MAG: Histidine-tRNA ligase [Candidatus Magasanikbacteria bacterium GW2011_GWA2_37_8]|uniref:Histidine--tRNA ligase n=1 Tax=Candidatus Magasanikbacteria bacterium GW2011_GWA2_37_8 TaxID=1619036 RepID=A0A0G0JUM9_9BACT|nr:MAG: Histidine-tRNA ligase [Candidatus Magasanikbacteria bacterium GW2011_GWA2_37_8]